MTLGENNLQLHIREIPLQFIKVNVTGKVFSSYA